MKIISMAWTTAAVKAKRKTKTRRKWDTRYARTFHQGDLVQVYDRSPRAGGKRFGIIKLLRDSYLQFTSEMTERDFEAEGFKYMEEQNIRIQDIEPRHFFDLWKRDDESVWVIEFEVISLEVGTL